MICGLYSISLLLLLCLHCGMAMRDRACKSARILYPLYFFLIRRVFFSLLFNVRKAVAFIMSENIMKIAIFNFIILRIENIEQPQPVLYHGKLSILNSRDQQQVKQHATIHTHTQFNLTFESMLLLLLLLFQLWFYALLPLQFFSLVFTCHFGCNFSLILSLFSSHFHPATSVFVFMVYSSSGLSSETKQIPVQQSLPFSSINAILCLFCC